MKRTSGQQPEDGENHVDNNKEVVNPHLKGLEFDFMYHLDISTAFDLSALFGDVKYVCMGGTPKRMEYFINKACSFLNLHPTSGALAPLGKTERYSMYKVGPIISVSHGMGKPSISILLHEVAKILYYAKAKNYVFIRLGTSGGIGVEPGSVVLTSESLNTSLKPIHKIRALGKTIKTPSVFSEALNKEIIKCNISKEVEAKDKFSILIGKTLSTDDFYEEQGRLDGYFCDFEEKDKFQFLNALSSNGVLNIEMESGYFGAFCYRAKIPAAVICVTLVNRLKGDKVLYTPETLADVSDRVLTVALNYIKARMDHNLEPLD